VSPSLVDVDSVGAPCFGLEDELAPFVSDWHAHRRHQLLYAASGTLRLEVGDAQWLLPPQRAAWIAALTPHRVRSSQPARLATVYLARRHGRDVPGPCRVFAVGALAREMILHAMRFGPEHDARDRVAGRFFAALADLVRDWAADARPLSLPAARSPELERAMSWTLANLGARPSLVGAARASGLSARSLTRRFADETRTTWRRFVAQARLLRAMELLSVPGARVTETAYEVGFESLGAFSHAFEAFAGETPRDYRRRVTAPRSR
jgi:AraC-like DNA-binding protein